MLPLVVATGGNLFFVPTFALSTNGNGVDGAL